MATLNFWIPSRKRHVYEVIGTWSQHVGSWVGLISRPVHVMRYEDMLTNPIRAFGQLARFLRLSPTDQQLMRAIENSSFSELKRQEAEHGFNERPPMAKSFFREGKAGQWREILSPAQIERIVQAHAPMMQRFGYLSNPIAAEPLLFRQSIEAAIVAGTIRLPTPNAGPTRAFLLTLRPLRRGHSERERHRHRFVGCSLSRLGN